MPAWWCHALLELLLLLVQTTSCLLASITEGLVHLLVQVQQAKKKLLAKLQEEVASKEDMALKRMLSEDEGTIKRRTQIADRLKLLKNASQEVAQVQF